MRSLLLPEADAVIPLDHLHFIQEDSGPEIGENDRLMEDGDRG